MATLWPYGRASCTRVKAIVSPYAKMRILALGGVLICVAGVTGFSALHNPPASPAPSNPTSSDYVDPGVCAGCHQDIARSYSATGMGRSFGRADANAVPDLAQGSIDNQPSDMHYQVLKRDGKIFVERSQTGFGGQETNVVEEQADYVIGSGNHARTYLHRDAQGKLIELPVSWYAESSGYWAMSPGYDRKGQEDLRRAIPDGCMFCHNGYPRPAKAFDPGSMDPPTFGQNLPEGIDCQRCHGPGRAHVTAAVSGTDPEAIRRAIVNPARLDRDRQLEVCMQCHLETSSSHMPNQIVRYDRNAFSYRPGEPLGDFMLYFEPVSTKNNDRFEIAHAAYRLRKSQCFLKSQMTCLTCHDPHKSYRGPGAMEHYVAICQGCHQSVQHTVALPAPSNCITCHMPARRTEDAVHVVMTDHYIQRVKPNRDLLAPLKEYEGKAADAQGIVLYYPPKLPATPGNELYLALAQVKDGSSGERGIERLRDLIAMYAPPEPEFYFELGRAYTKAGNREAAIRWYQEALRRRHIYPAVSKELAASFLAGGRDAQAEVVLKQALVATPLNDQLLADLGNIYLRQGQVAAARQALYHALDANPSLPEAENLLGLTEVRAGDRQEAEKRFRAAIRDDPDSSEAHNNLANLLTGTGQYQEAAYEFQKAIWIDPADAEAHHGYGLVLELTHAYDQAAAELEQAAHQNPRDAQTHGDLADLLAARGDLDGAGREYRSAIECAPRSAELYSSLAGVLAAQGHAVEAMQQFEKAIALKPDLYEAHLGLAVALAKQGRVPEALAHSQRAAQSPDPEIRAAALSLLHQLTH
jgi:predicted CXXCH cytochrome family protein